MATVTSYENTLHIYVTSNTYHPIPVRVFFFFSSSRCILNFNHLFDIAPSTIPSTNQGDVMNCSKQLKDILGMVARRYEITIRVLKNISRVSAAKFRVSARPSVSTSLLQLIIHLNCLSPRPQKILFSSSSGYYNRPKRNWAKFRQAGEQDLYQLVTCKV